LGVNVKDQNMQDEHDVEGNTMVSGGERCGIMQTMVVRDDVKG
jgi:hypothetical protein